MKHLSPDCRSANCRKCDERAWDTELDRLTLCFCDCHEPEPVECPRCEGTTKVTGDRYVAQTCPSCLGDGVVEPV